MWTAAWWIRHFFLCITHNIPPLVVFLPKQTEPSVMRQAFWQVSPTGCGRLAWATWLRPFIRRLPPIIWQGCSCDHEFDPPPPPPPRLCSTPIMSGYICLQLSCEICKPLSALPWLGQVEVLGNYEQPSSPPRDITTADGWLALSLPTTTPPGCRA